MGCLVGSILLHVVAGGKPLSSCSRLLYIEFLHHFSVQYPSLGSHPTEVENVAVQGNSLPFGGITF